MDSNDNTNQSDAGHDAISMLMALTKLPFPEAVNVLGALVSAGLITIPRRPNFQHFN